MKRGVSRKSAMIRFFPNSSKGLSTVITSLILILLAIVAIGIIWVVVRNIIGDATGGIGFEKFSLNLGINSAYIDGSQVKVVVRRTAGAGNLTGILFTFHNGTSSTNVKKVFALKELEERTFAFSSEEVGGIENVESVSVSPIYFSGGEDVVGGITDTAEIKPYPPTGGAGEETPVETCGNVVIDVGEECEGINLNGQSCETLGFIGGMLSCSSTTCQFNTASCTSPVCGNGICETGETNVSCVADCLVIKSCEELFWELAPEDLNAQCFEGSRCTYPSCICSQGFVSDGLGACMSVPNVNKGVVESVWPFDAVKYFDSNDFPKNSVQIVSYIGKWVNFSGAGGETRCLQISYAEYLNNEEYNKSYLRVELPVTVLPGDIYEIWVSPSCGKL